MSEAKLAHYLCHHCNRDKILAYNIIKATPDFYSICGHKFSYGDDSPTSDSDRCIVCMDMYQEHEAQHEREEDA